MTITEALITQPWYGYPTNGAPRRHEPHVLAVVHQTSTQPYDGEAMALRNARQNTTTCCPNTATYYVDPDGDAVHAVDGTKYASWCAGVLNAPDTTNAGVATIVEHNKAGFNPNECAWEQIECVGIGTEPWTDAQFSTAAGIIAARSKSSGLPINRTTVLAHRDLDTVNRPSDPWPAAIREARMAKLISLAITAGGDMNAVTEIPVAACTVKGPVDVFSDEAMKQKRLAAWAGASTVQLYAKSATAAAVRMSFSQGGPGEVAYIALSAISNIRLLNPPADTTPYSQADLDAAKAAGYADAKTKAASAVEAI